MGSPVIVLMHASSIAACVYVCRNQRRYFVDVVAFLRRQFLDHDLYKPHAKRGETGRLAAAADEAGDLMSYCNDILLIECEEISQALLNALLDGLILPVLLASLLPAPYSPEEGEGLSPLTCLHLLARFFGTFTAASLVNQVALCLLIPSVQNTTNNSVNANSDSNSMDANDKKEKMIASATDAPDVQDKAVTENFYRKAFLELLDSNDSQVCLDK